MKYTVTPGFNCVVKQLRFWLFKVDCEFKDCDLRVLRIGHTCVIYTLRSNNCELREKSQFAIFKLYTQLKPGLRYYRVCMYAMTHTQAHMHAHQRISHLAQVVHLCITLHRCCSPRPLILCMVYTCATQRPLDLFYYHACIYIYIQCSCSG